MLCKKHLFCYSASNFYIPTYKFTFLVWSEKEQPQVEIALSLLLKGIQICEKLINLYLVVLTLSELEAFYNYEGSELCKKH